ncbi:MAG TPA: hypothetical protein VE981_17255 [Planctomycetota bacterium]|nr:hypothetical protein [Planctomycetota bacterium]
MAGGAGQPKPETTFYRTQQGVGFNARVEPVWHTFSQIEATLGFFDRRRERKKVERVIDGVNTAIVGQKGTPAGWEKAPGACICHLRVAKMGLVRELKTWLKIGLDGQAEGRWPHLHVLRDRPCMLVPARFSVPLSIDPGGGDEALPVASAPWVLEELAAINKKFRIDDTFAIKKMVDFMDATDRDISIYEQRLGAQEGFWPKFAYVLLKKLADVSVEKTLPAIFA